MIDVAYATSNAFGGHMQIPGNVSLFEGIESGDIIRLLSCLDAAERRYSKGSVILREGEPVVALGIVLFGGVQIVRNGLDGNRVIMASFGTGDVFAESLACADIKKSPVAVIASEDSAVLFVPFAKMIHTCESACSFHRRLVGNMFQLLARKNLFLNTRLELASKRSIREKLVAYLAFEASRAQGPANGNASPAGRTFREIVIPYSRLELADYLFVDRSALSRELGKMQKDGLISIEKNRFLIHF